MMCLINWKAEDSLSHLNANQSLSLFIDYVLVIPGAICTVLIGLFSNWGFFKYKWITLKWIVGISVILIGTFILHPIALGLTDMMGLFNEQGYSNFLNGSKDNFGVLKIGSTVQALALIFLVYISVFKPWIKVKK